MIADELTDEVLKSKYGCSNKFYGATIIDLGNTMYKSIDNRMRPTISQKTYLER